MPCLFNYSLLIMTLQFGNYTDLYIASFYILAYIYIYIVLYIGVLYIYTYTLTIAIIFFTILFIITTRSSSLLLQETLQR